MPYCVERRGYRNHPQLERFRSQVAPLSAISGYLLGVYVEAVFRGYSFDRSKIGCVTTQSVIPVTSSQMDFEWQHLLKKLSLRSPDLYERWSQDDAPSCHPLFCVQPGPVEQWERP